MFFLFIWHFLIFICRDGENTKAQYLSVNARSDKVYVTNHQNIKSIEIQLIVKSVDIDEGGKNENVCVYSKQPLAGHTHTDRNAMPIFNDANHSCNMICALKQEKDEKEIHATLDIHSAITTFLCSYITTKT